MRFHIEKPICNTLVKEFKIVESVEIVSYLMKVLPKTQKLFHTAMQKSPSFSILSTVEGKT